ncbi:MAG: hypothetical protein EOP22_10470 [Hyphomicrobiales bacterium]|nr:MAG: hypothetical protein EOP22_10470 [Hyphomicrobiales bacterium]
MNRLIAFAVASALLTTGAFAQTVSDDVTKQLWCGTALSVAFGSPPEGVTEEQLAQAQSFIDGGAVLTDNATQAHLDAGFTQEAVDKVKADLLAEVTPVVTGNGEGARYSFEDCIALLPPPGDAAPSAQ